MSNDFKINLIRIENPFHSSFIITFLDFLIDSCYSPKGFYCPNL